MKFSLFISDYHQFKFTLVYKSTCQKNTHLGPDHSWPELLLVWTVWWREFSSKLPENEKLSGQKFQTNDHKYGHGPQSCFGC